MYKLLIEENTSMTATVKPNFGKTSFLYEALKKGDIDIYPEFTGTVTESLLQPSPKVSHEQIRFIRWRVMALPNRII